MRTLALLLLCALLAAQDPAAAQSASDRYREIMRTCPYTMPYPDRYRCIDAEVAVGPPCTGSVEERLSCLEAKVADHAREMTWLRNELEKLMTPRVQPMDVRRLSQQR